jgi:hypothetical protein
MLEERTVDGLQRRTDGRTLNIEPSRRPSDSGMEPRRNIMTCSSSALEDSSGIVSGKGPPPPVPPPVPLAPAGLVAPEIELCPDGNASFSN